MSVLHTVDLVEYPESDGKPVAETDAHFACMVRIQDILKHRYHGEDVYVGTDLLIYWRQGDPSTCVAPDNFVVLNRPSHFRRTYRIWDENGKVPAVVFEITSRSTGKEDEESKPATYAQLGVREYFLFDPLDEYLEPQLQGFRLVRGAYQPIKPDKSGALVCQKLKLTLNVEDGELVFRDRQSGDVLPTAAEAAEWQRQAEEKKRKEEAKKRRIEQKKREAAEAERDAAEARARELEEELKRLRAASQPDHRDKA